MTSKNRKSTKPKKSDASSVEINSGASDGRTCHGCGKQLKNVKGLEIHLRSCKLFKAKLEIIKDEEIITQDEEVIFTPTVKDQVKELKKKEKEKKDGNGMKKDTTFEDTDFEMAPELLLDVIKRQAGTVVKAVMEGIQNAIDSGAKNIIVNVEKDMFEVIDDGSGMNTTTLKEEFKKFGRTQKRTDESKIGEFGMGRGQMFAKGVCTFHTLDRIIVVDIRKKIGFEPYTTDDFYQGTKVKVELFENQLLNSYELKNVVNKLRGSFLIENCDIIINKESVEKPDMSKAKVYDTFKVLEKENCYEDCLFVKGIFIKNINGIIDDNNVGRMVMNDNLTLNFPRNDWIKDDKLNSFNDDIDKLNADIIKNSDKRKPFKDIRILIELFEKKLVSIEDLKKVKFIESYQGEAHYSPRYIEDRFSNTVYNMGNVESKYRFAIADKWKHENSGCVVDVWDSEIAEFIEDNFNIKIKEITDDEIEQLEEDFTKGEIIITENDIENMSNQKRGYLLNIRHYNSVLASRMSFPIRKILFCKQGKHLAYTDGFSMIVINMDKIDFYEKKDKFVERISVLLLHEYCHREDSKESIHGVEFLERFHDYQFQQSWYHAKEILASSSFWKIAGYIDDKGKVIKK